MRPLALRLFSVAALATVWVLLWGRVTVPNIIMGVVVAVVITVLLPVPPVPVQGRVHPVALVQLIGLFCWYLIESSIQLMWLAIRPGPPPLTGVLRVPLSIKSDLVLVLASSITTLIPGSMVLEIDQVRRILYCHVIDVGSAKAVERFYHQAAQVERLLIAAFERDDEWMPVGGTA
ncbi:Na+/H+ antiporter subunit E [Mycolicibacter minnesotensis]|uniref:Na+/H+ antiporter subunit E n=1 Tax=Mycolicibacter minnesotensis TaxID=1118379 RepID=A0A7I7R738_9MYCO|nr:Na+/H+ antiporter subunit E [Mycolicibacter minnesotensis]ORB00810.1 Na+/H+ antiporter subunit E [Mycolicibacter minnesotensis]BBY34483.1 Na+/H+ antiporter subunit E [Mycolicibacter minnesotensis]